MKKKIGGIEINFPDKREISEAEIAARKQQEALNSVVFFQPIDGNNRLLIEVDFDVNLLGHVAITYFFQNGTKNPSIKLGWAKRDSKGRFTTSSVTQEEHRTQLVRYVAGAIKARSMRVKVFLKEQAKPKNERAFVAGYDQRGSFENTEWLATWKENSLQRAKAAKVQEEALNTVIFFEFIDEHTRMLTQVKFDSKDKVVVTTTTFYANGRKSKPQKLGCAQLQRGKKIVPLDVEGDEVSLIKYVSAALKARNSRKDIFNQEQKKPEQERSFIEGYDERLQTHNASWLETWLHNSQRPLKAFIPRPLKAATLSKLPPQDLFSQSDADIRSLDDHTGTYNNLLYWLSANQKGTWHHFRTTCASLGLDNDGQQSRRISRRLRLLGHLEVLRNGQGWFVTQPTVVAIRKDAYGLTCNLVGQRSIKLLQIFQQNNVGIRAVPQEAGDAPEAIEISFLSEAEAEYITDQVAKQIGLDLRYVGFAGLDIGSTLPTLTEWQDGLSKLYIQTGRYEFRLLKGHKYESIPLPSETGLYQLTPHNKKVYAAQTLFYDASTDHWLQGDWYGLRYLAYHRQSLNLQAEYDAEKETLVIPLKYRWPELYERALVLSSGKLPTHKDRMLIFTNISLTLANTLINQLQI